MMMRLSLRCRYWSVLQVVAIVSCYQRTVFSEIAQDCVGLRLRLRCEEMKVIQITAVVLGDSECYWASCCIRDDDCSHNASENHRTDVHRRCDNKQSCTVGVLQEKIPCWYRGSWSNNDFERITYNCIDEPQRSTNATLSRPDSTESILYTEKNRPEKETENGNTTNSTDVPEKEGSGQNDKGHVENGVMPVVMATVCLLVLIAIVVVVVLMRRKRWPKVSAAVELTDIGSSDRNEAIYANENQSMSVNHGNGSSHIYSNDKIKKSRDKGAKASEAYEVPNNAVYSLANEDPKVNCDLESKEPSYQSRRPKSDVYSVVRDVGKPECVCPTQATNSSATNVYDEACDWKESENKAVAEDKTNPAQKKKTDTPAHKTSTDSYTNVSKPSKNAETFDSKDYSSGKVEANDKVSTSDGFPSPTYETMSPGIPESIYANEPALSPSWSLASRALSTGGSDTENPYCEMQSPPVRFKDDGSQTVVENDLYSH